MSILNTQITQNYSDGEKIILEIDIDKNIINEDFLKNLATEITSEDSEIDIFPSSTTKSPNHIILKSSQLHDSTNSDIDIELSRNIKNENQICIIHEIQKYTTINMESPDAVVNLWRSLVEVALPWHTLNRAVIDDDNTVILGMLSDKLNSQQERDILTQDICNIFKYHELFNININNSSSEILGQIKISLPNATGPDIFILLYKNNITICHDPKTPDTINKKIDIDFISASGDKRTSAINELCKYIQEKMLPPIQNNQKLNYDIPKSTLEKNDDSTKKSYGFFYMLGVSLLLGIETLKNSKNNFIRKSIEKTKNIVNRLIK